MGYSIVLPFLIIIVLNFGGNELIYGALGATYSFFQLIGAPILGKWSDKIGRRKVLLISQVGTFLAWVIFLIALIIGGSDEWSSKQLLFISIPLFLLFVARALDGITGGNVSEANAYLADITSEEDRKKNFGKMSASANLGFIAGPIDKDRTGKLFGQEHKECHKMTGEDSLSFKVYHEEKIHCQSYYSLFPDFSGLQFFLCCLPGLCYKRP